MSRDLDKSELCAQQGKATFFDWQTWEKKLGGFRAK